jgi:uncharacterized protein (DUF1800 family)
MTVEITTRADVAHLVRRVAFGATAERIDELAALGFDGAVDALTDFTTADDSAGAVEPPAFDTEGYLEVVGDETADVAARRAAQRRAAEERRALIRWWLQRMVVADRPQREWLTLAWHDHFATSLTKVKFAELMHWHYTTLYDGGSDHFPDLVRTIARDPAMLIWLDGRRNTAAAPNENFARELFELFTLGHGTGHHGQPYTESDVSEAARALTGWAIDRTTGAGVLRPRRHDDGTKSVLGASGPFRLDEIVDIATAHPACAPHVVARLWSRLARPAAPDDPVVVELAAAFADDLDIAALVRRMVRRPEFLDAATRGAIVKSPVQLVVGTARALGSGLPPGAVRMLAALGQVPFLPPDVDGWTANEGWISTSTTHARLTFAVAMAGTATDAVDVLTESPRPERAALVARLLSVDTWSPATTSALDAVSDRPSDLLAIAIASPEHALA